MIKETNSVDFFIILSEIIKKNFRLFPIQWIEKCAHCNFIIKAKFGYSNVWPSNILSNLPYITLCVKCHKKFKNLLK